MSDKNEFTTVCALDQVGDRYYIYDCDYHAEGGAYKSVITIDDMEYRVCAYPMEGRVEESGEKLPQLNTKDLESYFTAAPTAPMREVLEKARVPELPFAQLVMVIQHAQANVIYKAECIHVTKDGTECTEYEGPDFIGDDAWDIMEHIVDDAWYSYHRKQGDLEDD